MTFVLMNVFGRTLNRPMRAGRDHLGAHHCTVIIGKGIRGSVIGGVMKAGNDYAATAIDSKTGLTGTPDIRFEDTLGAVGKTIAAAVGVPVESINDQITAGKIVQAALVQIVQPGQPVPDAPASCPHLKPCKRPFPRSW